MVINRMVVQSPNRYRGPEVIRVVETCYFCTTKSHRRKPATEPCKLSIPIFEGIEEAKKAGWRKVRSPIKGSLVWACPECCKKYRLGEGDELL